MTAMVLSSLRARTCGRDVVHHRITSPVLEKAFDRRGSLMAAASDSGSLLLWHALNALGVTLSLKARSRAEQAATRSTKPFSGSARLRSSQRLPACLLASAPRPAQKV